MLHYAFERFSTHSGAFLWLFYTCPVSFSVVTMVLCYTMDMQGPQTPRKSWTEICGRGGRGSDSGRISGALTIAIMPGY